MRIKMATEANIDLLFSFLRYDSCFSVETSKIMKLHARQLMYCNSYSKNYGS